jgi:hypothetical protein
MLDIDVQKIILILRLQRGRSFPSWNISQPFQLKNEQNIDDDTKLIDIEITPIGDEINFQYFGKSSNDTILDSLGKITRDQSLKIENMYVNDVKIELMAIKDFFKFIPEYSPSRIEYAKNHNLELPVELHTDHMFDNGQWIFRFERPFFLWYNSVLMNQIYNSETSIWVKRSHLGLPDDSTLARLDTLLTKI